MKVYFYNISEFIKSENVRKLRSNSKKVYKHAIVELFGSIIFNDQDYFNQAYQAIEGMYQKDIIGGNVLPLTDKMTRNQINISRSFLNETYHLTINDSNIDSVMNFIRKYVNLYLEEEQTLYKFDDLHTFLNIEQIYENVTVLKHWWIDIKPFEFKPILTFPEYFAYQDLINTWNDALEKKMLMQKEQRCIENEKYRTISHSYWSSIRTSITLGVNFVESYLYYYYYNIKMSNKHKDNTLVNRKNRRNINDKEIIEDLIFKIYPEAVQELDTYYEEYKKVVKLRDRYVHVSAFVDDNSNSSELQPLLNIDIEVVANQLQYCVDLIVKIDERVEDKILFWWDTMEYPDFNSQEKIKNLAIKK